MPPVCPIPVPLVPPPKAQKIDLSVNYPCPCRRQGQLTGIALTEAFGCQRCQQIFVVKPDGYTMEQLSTIYPYKKSWYWTGQQWHTIRRGLGESYWLLTLGLCLFIFMPLLLWSLVLKVPLSLEVLLLIVATIFLAVVPALIVWLALYRR